MTILKKADFELQVPGTTVANSSSVSGLDGTPTGGGSATITADTGTGVAVRNHRSLVLERTSSAVCTPAVAISSATSIRIRFYLTWLTTPANQSAFFSCKNGVNNRAQIFFQNGPPFTIQLRNVTTLVGSASNTIVMNRRQRYEWKVDGPNAQQSLVVYDPDEVTKFYDSGNVTFTSNAFTALEIGNQATTTFKLAIDSILTSDRLTDELGPASNLSFGFNVAAAA